MNEPTQAHARGSCPDCGKRCYRTRKQARQAAKALHHGHMRAYRCGDWWHLGHNPRSLNNGTWRPA